MGVVSWQLDAIDMTRGVRRGSRLITRCMDRWRRLTDADGERRARGAERRRGGWESGKKTARTAGRVDDRHDCAQAIGWIFRPGPSGRRPRCRVCICLHTLRERPGLRAQSAPAARKLRICPSPSPSPSPAAKRLTVAPRRGRRQGRQRHDIRSRLEAGDGSHSTLAIHLDKTMFGAIVAGRLVQTNLQRM